MSSPTELFLLALQHHQAGGVAQAEPLYRQFLQSDPTHADAHAKLGEILQASGRWQEAFASYQEAIRLNPSHADAHNNLGIVLVVYGRQAEAVQCFQRALTINPNDANAHNNLGSILKEQGRLAEAAQCFRQAMQLDPNHAYAHSNLGLSFVAQGQPTEAILCFQQALRINPDMTDAHYNLGNALFMQHHLAEAILSYRQALRLDPRHAHVHNNLGIALMQQGHAAEAADCYREALRLNPDLADTHYNLANTLALQGEHAEAVASFRQALCLNPNHHGAYKNLGSILLGERQFAEAAACFAQALRFDPSDMKAHNSLGFALFEQGEYVQAAQCFREALAVDAQSVDALYNLGSALVELGQFAEAAACYEDALRLEPAHQMSLWNRSLLRLMHGDFAGGWPDYELRWAKLGKTPRSLPRPRWDGSTLAGKTILVYAEQGLGDTLQFARYLPMVQQRGGRVLFECQPALCTLLSGCAGADQVIPAGTPLPTFDVHVPLLSLPGIFGTTLATIPADVPYLTADRPLVAYWSKELALRVPSGTQVTRELRIGIVWQGSLDHNNDSRSLALAHFAALAQIPGVQLVSLQVGPGTKQIAEAPFPIIDLGSRFNLKSLADLAAAMMNMDLVVTIDTAVPHLAGALGVEVWTLLPFVADWRWLVERTDNPWYPTMRLFRQTRRGDWSEVFERVAKERGVRSEE